MNGDLLHSRAELNTCLTKRLHDSGDGRGLVDAAHCSGSSRSVDSESAILSGRDYIGFQIIRANALPVPGWHLVAGIAEVQCSVFSKGGNSSCSRLFFSSEYDGNSR